MPVKEALQLGRRGRQAHATLGFSELAPLLPSLRFTLLDLLSHYRFRAGNTFNGVAESTTVRVSER
jgi:hypothetical protein